MTGCAAIYDFELMPYALGDVLTWNVQTAIRCLENGRERVNVHICLDDRYPASIYQSDMITADNCGLFFNELFGAFGTHPRLGNISVHRRREDMIAILEQEAQNDPVSEEAYRDYRHALANRHDNDVLVAYFTKYIYYHGQINSYAEKHGHIPLLLPSMGCVPDVDGLVQRRFADKRIVPFHLRLRRIDAGYGGEHTYRRDSDFVEWYEFLTAAAQKYPDVQFIAMGRLQEKPLELLRLPNVTSLRTFGMGLGHELTLMLKSDLFIGTSSGFAAMANFSALPYYITKMGKESCNAYEIDFGCPRLPFAAAGQFLVYEPEDRNLLMRLLDEGLANVPTRGRRPPTLDPAIDVRSWEWERAQWLQSSATTARFHTEETYRDKETAFLLWPKIREAKAAWRGGWKRNETREKLKRMEAIFPQVCWRFPEFLRLRAMVAVEHNEWSVYRRCETTLRRIAADSNTQDKAIRVLRRYLVFGLPFVSRIRYIWRNRRYIPFKLRLMARRYLGILHRV
jgi:hypothetical protein